MLAFVLTMLFPGFGAAYLGRTLTSALIGLLFVSAAGGFVALWTWLKFFPALPLLVFLIGWSAVSLLLALDYAREAAATRGGYILRDANHPVAYLVLALATYLLPLAGILNYTSSNLWTLVWVNVDTMFPTLAEGDLLLIDRTAYQDHGPVVGEIVALSTTGDDGELVPLGRIIGLPGDQVSIAGSTPWINASPLSRTPVDHDLAIEAGVQFTPMLGDTDGVRHWSAFGEVNRDTGYITSELPMFFDGSTEAVALLEDQYYVLHDNRSRMGDSRHFGAIQRDQIVGRATFVAFSLDQSPQLGDGFFELCGFYVRAIVDGGVRWERMARHVQPAPQS